MKPLISMKLLTFLRCIGKHYEVKLPDGEIPAAKPAKQWVFLLEDLVSYLRSNYAQSLLGLQVQDGGDSLCCISDQIQSFGGANLQHQMETEYKKLLKQ